MNHPTVSSPCTSPSCPPTSPARATLRRTVAFPNSASRAPVPPGSASQARATRSGWRRVRSFRPYVQSTHRLFFRGQYLAESRTRYLSMSSARSSATEPDVQEAGLISCTYQCHSFVVCAHVSWTLCIIIVHQQTSSILNDRALFIVVWFYADVEWPPARIRRMSSRDSFASLQSDRKIESVLSNKLSGVSYSATCKQ